MTKIWDDFDELLAALIEYERMEAVKEFSEKLKPILYEALEQDYKGLVGIRVSPVGIINSTIDSLVKNTSLTK